MAFIDVIKYEGSNNTLIFKHPITDFNTKAQLIVHEKQEAIVFMNGEAKKVYPPGRYELKSDNLPGVKHLLAVFYGGEMVNHCEVYFVNKLLFSNIPWVTSVMDIQDHTIGNYYSFWAQGFFTVRIENSIDLFDVVGTGDFYSVDDLKEYFKERITSAAREVLSIAMNQDRLSYGEINSFLSVFSERVKEKVKNTFEKIGLSLEDFHFESVNMDKDTEFDKHREHLGERSGQKIEGYTYDKKRMYEVLEKQSENQGGAGAAASAVSGIGIGVGMGQVYGGMVGNAVNAAFGGQQMNLNSLNPAVHENEGVVQPHRVDQVHNKNRTCSKCGKILQEEWKYCPYCGCDMSLMRKCPKCGGQIAQGENMKFCPLCSAELRC